MLFSSKISFTRQPLKQCECYVMYTLWDYTQASIRCRYRHNVGPYICRRMELCLLIRLKVDAASWIRNNILCNRWTLCHRRQQPTESSFQRLLRRRWLRTRCSVCHLPRPRCQVFQIQQLHDVINRLYYCKLDISFYIIYHVALILNLVFSTGITELHFNQRYMPLDNAHQLCYQQTLEVVCAD